MVRKEIVKKKTPSAREGFEQEKVEMQAVFVTYGVFEGEVRESGGSRTVISKHGKKANCRSPEAQLPSSPCLSSSHGGRVYDVGQKRAPHRKIGA